MYSLIALTDVEPIQTTKTFLIVQVSRSMEMLSKFESMPGLKIDLSNKYQQVLKTFAGELQLAAAVYEAGKTNPEMPRNSSPITGRISWARQIYERIEFPMNSLINHPHLLKVSRGETPVQ
jgi:dynein heavy chain, axonemal